MTDLPMMQITTNVIVPGVEMSIFIAMPDTTVWTGTIRRADAPARPHRQPGGQRWRMIERSPTGWDDALIEAVTQHLSATLASRHEAGDLDAYRVQFRRGGGGARKWQR